ncbi:unnamed protein product [Clonostachys byssicola]|uniref:2EXR domain-containing protein n=1 Tax=Clonostachys byssicola TaxID=160290 RepID=A0A9N9UKY4_9HYPO|nr:unnamed protein product [Clonostachys byssicola]
MASTDDDPDGHGGDAADAPGPLTHFHKFTQLPPELRCRIWKMAIFTEKTPKIHYYSLCNDDEGYRKSSLAELIDMYKNPGPKDGVFRPFNPLALQCEPQQFSWADDNRLQSYWNAGLRTACWESRTILLRYYGPKPRRQNPFDFVNKRPYKRRKKKKKSCSTTNPSKIVTIREKGEIIHLDFSKRDIICFRFPPEEMARCVFLKWESLLIRLPFYHLPQNSDINLAFEFDHSWNEGLGTTESTVLENLQEASARGLVLRAFWAWKVGAIPRWTRLYLIDRAEPLPPRYQVGRNYDLRYVPSSKYPSVKYPKEFPCQRRESRVFIDGENKYVESYSWDRDGQNCCNRHVQSVAVDTFMRTVDRYHRPSKDDLYGREDLPFYGEIFFRVLRPVPRTED